MSCAIVLPCLSLDTGSIHPTGSAIKPPKYPVLAAQPTSSSSIRALSSRCSCASSSSLIPAICCTPLAVSMNPILPPDHIASSQLFFSFSILGSLLIKEFTVASLLIKELIGGSFEINVMVFFSALLNHLHKVFRLLERHTLPE